MTAMWLQRRFDRLAQDPKRQARWLWYAVGFYTVLRADVALFLLCLVAVAFGRVLENRAYDLEFYKERSGMPFTQALTLGT